MVTHIGDRSGAAALAAVLRGRGWGTHGERAGALLPFGKPSRGGRRGSPGRGLRGAPDQGTGEARRSGCRPGVTVRGRRPGPSSPTGRAGNRPGRQPAGPAPGTGRHAGRLRAAGGRQGQARGSGIPLRSALLRLFAARTARRRRAGPRRGLTGSDGEELAEELGRLDHACGISGPNVGPDGLATAGIGAHVRRAGSRSDARAAVAMQRRLTTPAGGELVDPGSSGPCHERRASGDSGDGPRRRSLRRRRRPSP